MPEKTLPISDEEIAELYKTSNPTRIAEFLHCAPNTIIRRLHRQGINTSHYQNKRRHLGVSKERLEELYCRQRLTYYQVAEILDCDFTAIPYWLKAYGIKRRTIWESRRPEGWTDPDSAVVCHLYESRGMGAVPIGKMFGVSAHVIHKILKANNIPIHKQGYPNLERYTSKDRHKVRSGLELQVDDWLFDHALEHEYEPSIPTTRWRGDFLVAETFIEIWGINSNAKYDARQREKKAVYERIGVPLISLYQSDFPHLEALSCLTQSSTDIT